MNVAQSIVSMPDRTPRERRDMAELRDVGNDGKIDWKGDCRTCYFVDGSALMMTLDNDFCPTEFLVIVPEIHVAAFTYAKACLATCAGWGEETLSHNIESNFPELTPDECEGIADTALNAASQP